MKCRILQGKKMMVMGGKIGSGNIWGHIQFYMLY